MKKFLVGLASAAVISLSATQANAVLVDFTNDFGGTIDWFNGGNSTTSGSIDVSVPIPGLNLSITVSSNSGILNSDTTSVTPPCGSQPLACSHDGIGIGANDDEVTTGTINSGERLTVSFSDQVDIFGIGFLDLFGPDASGAPAERAQWTANTSGGDTSGFLFGTEVFVNKATSSGFSAANVALLDLTEITFFNVAGPANSDFALALLDVFAAGEFTPVPIPAALPLFAGGLGLFGLLGWRRRQKAAAV